MFPVPAFGQAKVVDGKVWSALVVTNQEVAARAALRALLSRGYDHGGEPGMFYCGCGGSHSEVPSMYRGADELVHVGVYGVSPHGDLHIRAFCKANLATYLETAKPITCARCRLYPVEVRCGTRREEGG